MQDFTYQTAPMRVIFGTGTLKQLPDELVRLGILRALVVVTPNQAPQAARIAAMLGDRAAGIFAGAAMHTPVDVTDRAMTQVRELKVDGSSPSAAARPPGSARRSRCAPTCRRSWCRPAMPALR